MNGFWKFSLVKGLHSRIGSLEASISMNKEFFLPEDISNNKGEEMSNVDGVASLDND